MLQKSLRISYLEGTEKPTDALLIIEKALNDMSKAADWPISLTMRANLILEELVLNTLTYGSVGGLTGIDIELQFQDNKLSVQIIDDGAEFNPLVDAPIPDTNLPLQDRAIGGLGVFLVKTMSQDLAYKRENNRNHLQFNVVSES
ncbi:MAG: ATP-binding protein [Acidimicrobiia bacterium]|nr:ATP-binding protein [Acidimicrobiia bacterium]MYC57051.1 ATP-binding protein [Acidimicrobiia bacterium]MYG93658.1 ATP-binding protein [Acidimicrobiia bacterium]MYI30128.1 ATP-binding protein [Acidimicrobiia bacterium]